MIRRIIARFLCRILAPELDELITAAVNVKVNKKIVMTLKEGRNDFQTDTHRHARGRD